MINVDSALKIILNDIRTLRGESAHLTESLGRVLAEDIYASSDIPGFDNSAMDGYALRALDTQNASKRIPKILNVIEDRRAGYISRREIKNGQAIRIMTGAVMPKGSDSVVMVEDTQRHGKDNVKIFNPVKRGDSVRRKGEDIKKGEMVLVKGTRLNSAHVGLLASLGKARVLVSRKPKIAILATGDEVVDVGGKLKPGELRSSNTYTLYSQILKCGGIPKNLGIAKDKPQMLEAKLRSGLDCDMILTSGGVSVGDYDLVKFILAKMGTNIRFWKVAMRPGKPLVFGLVKGIPIFGLPGNPVSSMITFDVFVKPAMLKMEGADDFSAKNVDAVLEEGITKRRGLRYFVRAITRWDDGVYFTRTTGPQGSGILKSMALANSLIVLPEEEENVDKGVRVTVRFLE
ncbi:MAG: molybdopterin molybdotransferase MoeA [Candidatus Omnitrophota bacterium]|nr:molybdopterin molybdotransferase MoeA [Candidatus Omnitrophota bacterium]